MFLGLLFCFLAFFPDFSLASSGSQSVSHNITSGKSLSVQRGSKASSGKALLAQQASKGTAGDCYLSFADGAKPLDTEILVLGSGAFGLSFAQAISGNFKTIQVFARNAKTARQILTQKEIPPLPGVKLSSNIKPIMELEFFLNQAPQILILALPVLEIPAFIANHSGFFSELLKKQPELLIVSLSKGFYFKEGQIQFIQDLLADSWPEFNPENFYLISGPSFALDLAQGKKTLVSLAGQDNKKSQQIKKLFATETLDLEISEDLKGIAFGGAIKNVMAIVGGIAHGLNLSPNSKTSLLLRANQELITVGQELGASQDSFLGPAYLGDLILSLEKESRNTRLGLALGTGQSLSAFKIQNPNVNVEGLNTIKNLNRYLQDREGFEFIKTLYNIIYEEQDPKTLLLVGWPDADPSF